MSTLHSQIVNHNDSDFITPSVQRHRRRWRRVAVVSFWFFLIKGVVWLASIHLVWIFLHS